MSERGRGDVRHTASRNVPEGGSLLYRLTRQVCRFVGVTFFDFRGHGLEKVPEGGVIIASTHASTMDPWIVGMGSGRAFSFLAKETLFEVPFLGWLIRRYDAFPLPRESVAARRSLDLCVRILQSGRALLVFPEGTRSRDGKLQPLKRGIALMAKRSGAAVLPVLVRGTYACWPKGAILPRTGKVRVHVGDPIRFENDDTSDLFVERLARIFRMLAVGAGAPEMIGGGPLVGEEPAGGGDVPSSPDVPREASTPSPPAGDVSPISCTTGLREGSLSAGEA